MPSKESKRCQSPAGQAVIPPSLAVTSTGTNSITLVVRRTDEPKQLYSVRATQTTDHWQREARKPASDKASLPQGGAAFTTPSPVQLLTARPLPDAKLLHGHQLFSPPETKGTALLLQAGMPKLDRGPRAATTPMGQCGLRLHQW